MQFHLKHRLGTEHIALQGKLMLEFTLYDPHHSNMEYAQYI